MCYTRNTHKHKSIFRANSPNQKYGNTIEIIISYRLRTTTAADVTVSKFIFFFRCLPMHITVCINFNKQMIPKT